MTERRRFLRFETALNAFCEAVTERWKAASKVTNISKDGALVEVTRPLKQGQEIKLSMDVPGDNVPIFASCEVAWQKERSKADRGESSYETGVKFTKIDGADKGRLLEYIYTEWLRIIDQD